MNKFNSILASKSFPPPLYKPRFNKEFFKRLAALSDALPSVIESRCKGTISSMIFHPNKPGGLDIDKLIQDSQKLTKLRNDFKNLDLEIERLKVKIDTLEEKLIPVVMNLPNRYNKHVPKEDVLVDEIKSNFSPLEPLVKKLCYKKLSYINNCYSKSVVGTNSHYYFGFGAKMLHALTDYFVDRLERRLDFTHASGLCLVRSEVIEASNSIDIKYFGQDPCRLESKVSGRSNLHLTEASRESLLGFITTLGHVASNEPVRLMTSGAGYRFGSDWFDSDQTSATQFETLHALSYNPSIEQYSMKEYHNIRDILWNSYRDLGLPSRLVHCSLGSMLINEYDAHKIEVWLPSRNEWSVASRISHYLDYLTVRSGMKRGHIIDSMIFDGQILCAAIMENNQLSNGKFIAPPVLKDHIVHLTAREKNDHFDQATVIVGSKTVGPRDSFTNFEQRRYIHKKRPEFSHSERSINSWSKGSMPRVAFMILFVYYFTPWQELWIQFIPDPIRRFLYDRVFRQYRRLIWWIVFKKGDVQPKDLTYDELDKSHYEKTSDQRRKEKYRPR